MMAVSLQKLFTEKKPKQGLFTQQSGPEAGGQQLFLHGGKGSGFQGHRGRPGMVGGSSKGDKAPGSFREEMEEFSKKQDEKLREELEARKRELDEELARIRRGGSKEHRERVEAATKKLGFPVDRVKSTEEQGYLFNVGDQQFRAGADYNPATGEINVYNVDEMSDMEMQGILAHEIMHDRWTTFRKEYQRQFVEVERNIRASDDIKDWLINADGSLKTLKDRKKYWAYHLNDKFLTGDSYQKLKDLDGVSEYSTAYWNKAKGSVSILDTETAINETLAEIARIESNLSGTGIGIDEMSRVDPLWREFYKGVKHGGVKQNLFYFEVHNA